MPPGKRILSTALEDLARDGILPNRTTKRLQSQSNRVFSTPTLKPSFGEPEFAAILIDRSPSMEPYREDVIKGQNQMLEVLRGSAQCRKNSLYLSQYLFARDCEQIHPYTILSKSADDQVVSLTPTSYQFKDCTALYKSTFYVLQDGAAAIAYARQNHANSRFVLAVITDGEDNVGEVEPSDIKVILDDLRAKQFLRKAVLIGMVSDEKQDGALTLRRVQELRDILGFDEAVALDQNASKIREAFLLMSKSIAGASK